MKKAKLVPVDVEKLKIGDDIVFSVDNGKNRHEAKVIDILDNFLTYKYKWPGIISPDTTVSKNILNNIMRYE